MLKSLTLMTASFLVAASYAASREDVMRAHITSTSMRSLSGNVSFENVEKGTRVTGHFSGLKPNTTHGFHVHEKGECKGPDYKSAGGHYNPNNRMHGSPDSASSHVGDLGNLIADANGMAGIDEVVPHNKAGDFKKMLGKAVIIHSEKDDMRSQPSGDSGDRIACGVISKI